MSFASDDWAKRHVLLSCESSEFSEKICQVYLLLISSVTCSHREFSPLVSPRPLAVINAFNYTLNTPHGDRHPFHRYYGANICHDESNRAGKSSEKWHCGIPVGRRCYRESGKGSSSCHLPETEREMSLWAGDFQHRYTDKLVLFAIPSSFSSPPSDFRGFVPPHRESCLGNAKPRVEPFVAAF